MARPPAPSLTLLNVEIEGRGRVDVRLADGLIAAIERRLPRTDDCIDGHGGVLLPGLIDHHIHLFAAAAAQRSIAMHAGLETGLAALAARLASTPPAGPDEWLRVTGFSEGAAPLPDRVALDAIEPDRPLRVQHRTGALWILNSRALATIDPGLPLPPGVERDERGEPTGRIFREDAWLGRAIPRQVPDLAPIARDLDRFGITGVTDASISTDDGGAMALLGAATRASMRQRINLMSGGPLVPDPAGRFSVGPVKQLLDDATLGSIDGLVAAIRKAHDEGRSMAIHCVTAAELAFALAAWNEAGAMPGDRIEHGSVIDDAAADAIAEAGLRVVTQPGFLYHRGDRYLADVDIADQPHLYRVAGLRARGIPIAGSSDAPYGPLDPWLAMRAAVDRQSSSGRRIGSDEAISPRDALGLYLSPFDDPGGCERKVEVGDPADLCLMALPLAGVLDALSCDLVARTIIGGKVK